MKQLLKSFLNKLANLNSNNKSLCLLKLNSDQHFDLHQLDFFYKYPSFEIINQLISGKKKFFLCDEMDSRDEKINEISKKLKKIYRKDKILLEEIGAQDLYIGWPFVKGKFSDGTRVSCPLLFFPIELSLENGKWSILQRSECDSTLNKSFALAYSHFNSVHLPDAILDSTFNEFNTDSTLFRTELYEFLKSSPIELNFNQDLFKNTLTNFKESSHKELDSILKNGELKLYPEAVLGIFPQSNSYLVPDYESLITQNEFPSIEDFFASKTIQSSDTSTKEANTYMVFPTDATQEAALIKIKEGKSIVVQGPPGTGKSQLICNIVSDFTARGKKVAVVCRKKAALDVVYERLKTKNIHPFVGIVHDFKNDRNKLFEQIKQQIEGLEIFEKQNNGLDTIQLERTFTQSSRQIQQLVESFDNFKRALFDTSDFGISVKELYLTSNPAAPYLDLRKFATRFNLESSISLERKLKNYFPYANLFVSKEYPWIERISFANFYQRDLQPILDTISKIPLYQKKLKESAERQLKTNSISFTIDFFKKNKKVAIELNHILKEEEDFYLLLKFLKNDIDTEWLNSRKKKIEGIFKQHKPEISLSNQELDDCEYKINAYLASRETLVARIYWNLFSGEKKYLANVLQKNNLSFSSEGVLALAKRIVSRKKLIKEKTTIDKKNIFSIFPSSLETVSIERWFNVQFKILEAKEILNANPEIQSFLEVPNVDFKSFIENIQFLPLLALDVESNYRKWMELLVPEMIEKIISEKVNVEELKSILMKDFDHLIEFDKIKSELLSFEAEIIESIIENSASKSLEEKIELFRNSIRLEWISILEEKNPALRSVSTFQMEQMEQSIKESIGEKEKVSNEILLLRLKEQCYKNNEFNRLQNRTTYRDLFHQVSKKKKRWPLRKLIQTHHDEITNLLPCWLVSPETISALFPLEATFDLIIFDEASQCYTEQGIPAMYRGKQIVIAGDSKQLKPYDLYQTRWEDETESSPDLEIDSLLELAEKYLPSTQLKGHYRSSNLALIDFSNTHFYGNTLALIPKFSEINSTEPPIEYIKLDGIWENNTNTIEAEKVTELTFDLLLKYPEKTIGIVTFNFKQAQLITDLIEKKAIETNILLPESLFIKNIENVQGDEKDIILFSIGYAPNKNGVLNMQFGSLNQEGGENRLNVAITRAREKIFLVSSIMPQQLNVEETIHEGPKLFKKYLSYARQVSEKVYHPTLKGEPIQSRDWYLSRKVASLPTRKSVQFTNDMPFADITVKENEQYHSLLLTDDQLYFNSISAKEFHAYKPLELQSKGWNAKQLYSRNYWLHQNHPIDQFLG